MKTIADRFKEQKARSAVFTRENYGLMVGDGFPELCREFFSDEKIATSLALEHVTVTMKDVDEMKAAALTGDMARVGRYAPIAMPLLSWLYWGIEIGRELEREASSNHATVEEGK